MQPESMRDLVLILVLSLVVIVVGSSRELQDLQGDTFLNLGGPCKSFRVQ